MALLHSLHLYRIRRHKKVRNSQREEVLGGKVGGREERARSVNSIVIVKGRTYTRVYLLDTNV